MPNRVSPVKKIGAVPFEPSVLALGCWAFGGAQWGGQEDSCSLEAIQTALDEGITHFDTAQGYGKGRSEKLCGRQLRDVREHVFIATKRAAGTRDQMLSAVHVSLERLQTDYIDLFYIHWPRTGLDLRDTMQGLVEARRKGKIRGIGVSNFSIEQMRQVLEVGPVDAHQLCYNLLWRRSEADVLPFCLERDISVVTYSSLAQGILTGKFPRAPRFEPGDNRPRTVPFEPEVWPHVFDVVEQMKVVAGQSGRPLAHLAIQWVARQPGVTSVLAGARNGEQARQNAGALAGNIDDSVLEALQDISDVAREHMPDAGNIFRHYP